MHSDIAVVGNSSIITCGAPSLIQGVYGARGNLELVTCDDRDGLWVFWFNSDLAADPPAAPDVPAGTWSAGLRFASGRHYQGAQILQSDLGPNHLEVLALTDDGALESWFWSPGPGFQRRIRDAGTGVASFRADHDRGTLRVTMQGHDALPRHVESPPRGYPSRVWLPVAAGPSLDVDAGDDLVAAGVAADTIMVGSARRARSERAGGTTELTWHDADGRIRHLALRD